jgi:hypothetical protein
MARNFSLLLTAILVIHLAGCSTASPADQDIAAGILRLKRIGSEEPGRGQADREAAAFATLLRERCGAEVVDVPKPATDREKTDIDRYNHRMQQEIDRRHGEGTVVRLRAEAKQKAAAEKPADHP